MFPVLELLKFSSIYTDWPTFRDLFSSMVKDDNALPSLQELHYLKVSLIDEPAQLIFNMPTTGDNFVRAWNTLLERYDNKRVLMNTNLGKLFGLKVLTKENASDLRALVIDTCEIIGAL